MKRLRIALSLAALSACFLAFPQICFAEDVSLGQNPTEDRTLGSAQGVQIVQAESNAAETSSPSQNETMSQGGNNLNDASKDIESPSLQADANADVYVTPSTEDDDSSEITPEEGGGSGNVPSTAD